MMGQRVLDAEGPTLETSDINEGSVKAHTCQ